MLLDFLFGSRIRAVLTCVLGVAVLGVLILGSQRDIKLVEHEVRGVIVTKYPNRSRGSTLAIRLDDGRMWKVTVNAEFFDNSLIGDTLLKRAGDTAITLTRNPLLHGGYGAFDNGSWF